MGKVASAQRNLQDVLKPLEEIRKVHSEELREAFSKVEYAARLDADYKRKLKMWPALHSLQHAEKYFKDVDERYPKALEGIHELDSAVNAALPPKGPGLVPP